MNYQNLLSKETNFTFKLADDASKLALELFHNKKFTSKYKEDGTPVTTADITVENFLLENIKSEWPEDNILSEENGITNGKSNRRWIIDPIDGTFNFVEGKPQWGIHIALELDGNIVIGVITRPVLNKRWWAILGVGSFCTDLNFPKNNIPLKVSEINTLSESRVSLWTYSTNENLEQNTIRVKPDLDDILRLLEGELEIVIDLGGKPWDHAPAVLLVQEAGGHFEDNSGGNSISTGGGWYSNSSITTNLIRKILQV